MHHNTEQMELLHSAFVKVSESIDNISIKELVESPKKWDERVRMISRLFSENVGLKLLDDLESFLLNADLKLKENDDEANKKS
jgi:hypothetical protein